MSTEPAMRAMYSLGEGSSGDEPCSAGGGGVPQDGAGAALPREASLAHKRHRAAEREDVSSDVLTLVLTVMAQNHKLPKDAWSLCKVMHEKVKPFARLIITGPWPSFAASQAFVNKTVIRLELRGSFEVDPLLALALRAQVPATGGADSFDTFFRDVAKISLRHYAGVFTRIPRALQALYVIERDLVETLPMLRAVLRATDSGPQRDALTLVKSVYHPTDAASLPACTVDLPALESLDLSHCTELETLPCSIGNLTMLTLLDLTNCNSLMHLPASIGNLTALESLSLRGCDKISRLPDTIGALASLETLTVSCCSDMAILPACLGDLAALTWLSISMCGTLTALPDSICNLMHLRMLTLEELPIETLPQSIGRLTALQVLEVERCDAFRSLPDSIGGLQSLAHLTITDTEALVALPDTLCSLSALITLELSRCTQLTALPNRVGDMQALEYIDLEDCELLAALPDSMGNLQLLKRLYIVNCHQLTELPRALLQLNRLTRIDAEGCQDVVTATAEALAAVNLAIEAVSNR